MEPGSACFVVYIIYFSLRFTDTSIAFFSLTKHEYFANFFYTMIKDSKSIIFIQTSVEITQLSTHKSTHWHK